MCVKHIPRKQRALVLQGGGALGAYQVGALKVLSKKLIEEDQKNDNQGRPLFDIIAGTSIGAMNAAVLVSNVVRRNKTWSEAIDELERFWKVGIALKEGITPGVDIPPIEMFTMFPWWKPWKEKWKEEKKIEGIASEELARRYYSTKYFVFGGKKVFSTKEIRPDFKFLDTDNKQIVLNDLPLQERIKEYGEFPIATSFESGQPRLLITAVDIAEGVTVTFDSYKKKDGTMKTSYFPRGKYGYSKKGASTNNNNDNKNKNNIEAESDSVPIVIEYENGIELEHIMASGTLPGLYDPKTISKRKFWDGGLLSNTPLRELLESHRGYWMNVENKNESPDLDVYIVNVHPSFIDINNIPSKYDEIKDRNNDIIYGDRTYSEQYLCSVIADYTEFIKDLERLAIKHLKEDGRKKAFEEEVQTLRANRAKNTSYAVGEHMKYDDVMRGRFKITNLVRIERKFNPNTSMSFKVGDITLKTIEEMIKEGEDDAMIEISH